MGVLCLCAAFPAFSQTFQPKTIHFVGAEGYTDKDLTSASGLQPGTVLSAPDVNARTQKLMDTGIFAGLSYKFDGIDLVFSVKPALLYSIRLENIPLAPGPDLDAQIRQRVPLYRGKVPSDGGLLNDVRAALEEILKAQGFSASIQVSPAGELGQNSVSAMSFTITSPQVLIGAIQTDGGPLDPDAQKVLATLSGAAYDSRGSSAAIVRDTSEVYRSKGYLDAKVNASQLATLTVAPDAVHIPFRMSVVPGPLYKVATIQLAPGMIISQADFDKQAGTRPGDAATAEHIAENWHFIERQYHNHGYMRAQVKPVVSLDNEHGTASYTVSAVAGPVYTMGKLTIENVSDDLRAAILKAWKMQEGSVFNEGSILGFFATNGVNPQLERIFARVNVKYVLKVNDETRTVDTAIRLERKP
jgi:outer membrane protein assembly factor BamA